MEKRKNYYIHIYTAPVNLYTFANTWERTKAQILINNPIAVCSVTRASTIKLILFDSALDKIGLEDWELWIHLFSLDYKFIYCDKLLFKIRVLENSRTFQVANKNIPIAKKYIFNLKFMFSIFCNLDGLLIEKYSNDKENIEKNVNSNFQDTSMNNEYDIV